MNVAARLISGPSDRGLLDCWRSRRGAIAPAARQEKRHKRLTGDRRWERDPFIDETPRQARARVEADLANGRRCLAPLKSGAPCSLLLPCADHDHG